MNIKQSFLLFFILIIALNLQAEENNPTFRRIAIYVGSNDGGPERIKLLYAGTDALALHNVMQELGGIESQDNYLLFDPDISKMESTYDKVKNEFNNQSDSNQRTEFFFYYSGHSDEHGLLLGGEQL